MTTATSSSHSDFSAWFAAARRRLSGHGLWLDGSEPGRQPPAEFAAAGVRVLLCRLSTYAGTLPSITHRMLYWSARQVDGVYADLAFLPPATDVALLERDGVPWWLASGCKLPPAAFDVVAITASVPQEAVNLPAALQHSGLALGAARRLADPAQPLIVLGGNAAASLPFIHGDAAGPGSGGLADLVCNGDGVDFLQDLLRRVAQWKNAGRPGGKEAFLAGVAAALPGAYVPSLYDHQPAAKPHTVTITARAGAPLPVEYRRDDPESWMRGYDGGYLPFAESEPEETLPLAIGCHYRCRFCQTGWGRGPETDSPADALAAAARRVKAATACSDLNLLASDACSVPVLEEALDRLRPLFRQVSVKSLAVASLARDPQSRDLASRLDKHEFSLGVEGISDRLRVWLGKQADPAELVQVLRSLAPSGLRQVKLFLIATGRETAADVTEFLELFHELRCAAPSGRFIASFTPLFHAPFTPLQFAAVQPPDPAVMRQLETGLRNLGGEFRWSATPAEIAFMNRLTRAGRRATPALVRLSLETRARYGDALPDAAAAAGEAFLKETLGAAVFQGLDADSAGTDLLPWDDFAAGTPRKLLWKAFVKATKELAAGHVIRADAAEFAAWGEEPEPPPPAAAKPRPPVRTPHPVCLPAVLPPAAAWQPESTLARGLVREWLHAHPDAVEPYAGNARLVRLPQSFGRAVLCFDLFPPAGTASAVAVASPLAGIPEAPVFLVRLGGLEENVWRRLEGWLRTQKIKYQTRRQGSVRWQAVARSFHAKFGVLGFGQDTALGHGWLFCTEKAAPFLKELAAAGVPPPEVLAFCRPAAGAGKCPVCGETRVETVSGLAADGMPAVLCPACPPPA